MNTKLSRSTAIGVGLATSALLVAACSSTASTSSSSSPAVPSSTATGAAAPSAATTTAQGAGSYITWDDYQKNKAQYAGNNVVLFFNASWCPTCQRTVESLDESKGSFPTGLTVVSVDYDTSSDLKKEYGVTTQHTFVQVSPTGEMIKKWSGSETVDAINAKV